MRRVDLKPQRILLSSVTATGDIDPHGFVALAWAMVDYAGGALGRGCDLAAHAFINEPVDRSQGVVGRHVPIQ
jgi:hypothetical protein